MPRHYTRPAHDEKASLRMSCGSSKKAPGNAQGRLSHVYPASEANAKARGGGEVVAFQIAGRQAAGDLGVHDAGVKIDALQRTLVDHAGPHVLVAFAASA